MKKGLICLLVFSVFSCGGDSEDLPVQEKSELASVNVYKVSYEEITLDLTSFGSISFRSKADVSSTVDGTLVSLNVEEGDTVRKGDTLAVMSNIQLQIREDQAESALMSARAAPEL